MRRFRSRLINHIFPVIPLGMLSIVTFLILAAAALASAQPRYSWYSAYSPVKQSQIETYLLEHPLERETRFAYAMQLRSFLFGNESALPALRFAEAAYISRQLSEAGEAELPDSLSRSFDLPLLQTSLWGSLAVSYRLRNLNDSAAIAYSNGRTVGGFPDYLVEFAKNTLVSCDNNTILLTQGDALTFALYYVQQTMQFRTDVSVVNISLLNFPWYIKSAVTGTAVFSAPIPLTRTENEAVLLKPKTSDGETISIPVPKTVAESLLGKDLANYPESFAWPLPPRTLRPDRLGFTVSDRLIVDIIKTNAWKHPVCFTLSVSAEDLIGLKPSLRVEGLVRRLVPAVFLSEEANHIASNANLFDKPAVNGAYKTGFELDQARAYSWDESPDIDNLLKQYRFSFVSLAFHLILDQNKTKAAEVLDAMFERLNLTTNDLTLAELFETAQLYIAAEDSARYKILSVDIITRASQLLENGTFSAAETYNPYRVLYESYLNTRDYASALSLLKQMKQKFPNDNVIDQQIEYVTELLYPPAVQPEETETKKKNK